MTFPGLSGRSVRFTVVSLAFSGSAFWLLGCGGAGGSGSNTFVPPPPPAVTTNPNVTAKSVYTANTADTTVDVYAANQSGAVSTTRSIFTAANLPPEAITADASDNIYVGVDTLTGGQVWMFASGATTPSLKITLPNAGDPYVNQIQTLTTDSLGNLYVAASGGTSAGTSIAPAIYVYAPGATGAATPLRAISGAATMLRGGSDGTEQMSVDSKDNLYVAISGYPNGSVVMFPVGATGNVAPTLVTSTTYSASGVTLDAQDNIYISQSRSNDLTYPAAVHVFAKGSVAGATPTRTITGSATGMFTYLNNIHVDSAGNIFVEQTGQGHPQFLVYSLTANGNVAPSSALTPARGSSVDAQFYLK